MSSLEEELEEELKKVGIEKKPPYWSAKYLKNVKKLSKPVYKIRKETDVYAIVRDGVKLCMDIFRPDIEGRFPALVAWSSYGKTVQSMQMAPQSIESLVFDHTIEAGDIDFFVSRGYAFIIPDPRGIGKSEGEWHGFYSPQEQEDCYDVIEWCAQQPWCDGNVGMAGISYFGIIQALAAAQQPPHLKAIMPIEVTDSYYLHSYYGGILNTYYSIFIDLCPVNNGVPESEKLYKKEDLKRKIKERLEDPDIKNISYLVRILTTWPPRFHTWFLDVLLNPLDGPFWHARSVQTKYDKIKIPTYLYSHWFPMGRLSQGVFTGFMDPKLNVPKKASIDLAWPFMLQLPYRFGNEDILRWYDHWLKGVDTGIMDEPPIKIFVMGINRFRYENEWPLARTRWTKYYLRRFSQLDLDPEGDEEIPPDILIHKPLTITADVPALRYSTEHLLTPVEVTGPIALYLYASIDQEDANFIAKLWDVSPQGERTLRSNGFLKASHRTLDQEKSKPWCPVHDHTKVVAVKPGEINEYAIEINTISTVFLPGHRIELEIKTMDPNPAHKYVWSKLSMMGPLPSSQMTHYQIYRDIKYQSYLLLPVIPKTPPELWID